jgi:hypothetical protein
MIATITIMSIITITITVTATRMTTIITAHDQGHAPYPHADHPLGPRSLHSPAGGKQQ